MSNASHITDASVAALPATFVMKANHMSGGVVLVREGQGKCLKKCTGTRYSSGEPTSRYLRRACAKMLSITYGVSKGEMFYASIPKKCPPRFAEHFSTLLAATACYCFGLGAHLLTVLRGSVTGIFEEYLAMEDMYVRVLQSSTVLYCAHDAAQPWD